MRKTSNVRCHECNFEAKKLLGRPSREAWAPEL
jgi:hypothetical protein